MLPNANFDLADDAYINSHFVYNKDRDYNNPIYERKLEYMILTTLWANSAVHLTENQLSGLFRKVYNVPEDMTRRTLKLCCSMKPSISDNLDARYVLVRSTWFTPSDGKPVETVRYSVSSFFDPKEIASVYANVVDIDLTLFQPREYKRPRPQQKNGQHQDRPQSIEE